MNSDVPNNPVPSTSMEDGLVVAQYQSLRAEIVSIIAARYQTVQITIIALGTTIAAGIQFANPIILMAYPVLALILASSWATDERSVRNIAAYIADRIEKPFSQRYISKQEGQFKLDWELHMRALRKNAHPKTPFTAALGIFFISEVTAFVIGILIFARGVPLSPNTDLLTWFKAFALAGENLLFLVFLVIDVFCMLMTIRVMASIRDYQLDS